MATEEPRRRRPNKRWVGKRLTARKNMTVPVMSGSDAKIAEVLDGQELEVIEVQDDGWLKCRLRHDMFFKDANQKRVHAKDLVVGIHVEHDIDKFHVRKKHLREDTSIVSEITLAAQRWIEAQKVLDRLSIELVQLATRSPEMNQRILAIVPELANQKERITKAMLSFQRYCAMEGTPDWFDSAFILLNGLFRDFQEKGAKLWMEIAEYKSMGEARNKLTQTFSWFSSFVRRIWTWLRKTEKKITELEGLVFYS